MAREKIEIDKKIGERLRESRKRLGLNQVDFSYPLGIKPNTLCGLEKGLHRISASVLELIEAKHGINRAHLLTGGSIQG